MSVHRGESPHRGPLEKAQDIVEAKLTDLGIARGSYPVVLPDIKNPNKNTYPAYIYYKTDRGQFILKGEQSWWLNKHGIAINSHVFDTYITNPDFQCNLFYWCERFPMDRLYWLDNKSVLVEAEEPFIQDNGELVRLLPLRTIKRFDRGSLDIQTTLF